MSEVGQSLPKWVSAACPVEPAGNLGNAGAATRYDKLAANHLAFIKLASIRIWLRANESAP
jgi:hypothetical protein